MRIFLTGSSGFIGTALLKNLLKSKKYTLAVLTRKETAEHQNISIIKGELGNTKEWEKELLTFNPDTIVHLAWEGIPDHGTQISKKNIEYAINLFDIAKRTSCKKIICTGSCFEYGTQKGKQKEESPATPTDPFTAAKHFIQQSGKDLLKGTRTKFVWARLFFVYGPEQRKASLIPTLVTAITKGEQPQIRKPEARKDFIYVEDVARGIEALIGKENSEGIYNIGSETSTSVKEIAKEVAKQLQKNIQLEQTNAGEESNFWSDSKKIKELGWKPQITITEGIKKYLQAEGHIQ